MKTSRFPFTLLICLLASLILNGSAVCLKAIAGLTDVLVCQQATANHTAYTLLPGQGPRQPLFLWKITAPDGHFIYLLGSMHLVPPDVYPLPAELLKIFHQCRSATFEVDQSKLSKEKLQQLITTRGIYEPGDALDNHISDRTRAELVKYTSTRQLSMDNLRRIKPWALSLTISVMELQRLGLDAQLGIDKYFLDEAKAQNKPVYELETAEFQVDLLAGFSEPFQDKFLLQSLLELKDMKTYIDALVSAWKKGDAKAMNEKVVLLDKDNLDLEPLRQKLLYDRNYDMKDKLEAFLKDQSQGFVVVGAAHLVGTQGLLNLFAKDGYKVEQVYTGSSYSSKVHSNAASASKPKAPVKKQPAANHNVRRTGARH